MPRCILYYPNIRKAEGRGKSKTLFLIFGYAEAHPILSKYTKSREQRQIKNTVFNICPQPSALLYLAFVQLALVGTRIGIMFGERTGKVVIAAILGIHIGAGGSPRCR